MSTGDTPQRTRVDPADLVGRTIADRYALARLVTAGANTWVYDATDRDTGRIVTVKLLRPSIAAPPSFRERFDDEMRGVAALSHPNIVALFDWGISPVGDVSTAFVVTEALAGGSLRDMFDRGRRLTPSQALMVGLDACRGLDHAHRRGFVHTELTPSKLVFGDDRRLRIADFGLARLLGAASWERPESVPNHVAWYAAPEQGAGSPLDGGADVYALCLSMHEAVTGEVPFRTDSTIATLAARVGRLMPVSADLGPLAAVLEHAGRPEATERATAAQFGKELVQAASKLPRPEPLPLLSSGLFDTPADQLRGPDDPTGGVTRPGTQASSPIVVVPATPDESVDEPVDADDVRSDVLQGVPIVTAAEVGESDLVADDPDAAVDGVDAGELLGDVTSGDELVILPVDSELDGGPEATLPEPAPIPAPVETLPAADPAALPVTAAMPVTAPAPSQAHRPARRRNAGVYWKITLGVLLLAALAVLGVLASQLLRTPEYLVPNLVGTPEAEARNLVAANDWDVVVERERSDLVPVVGQVIRTVPSAGVSLAEGEPFLIVVSEGPVLRELPDSTGYPLVDAETRLRERGLVPRITEVFDEVVPLGTVVSWSVPGDPTLGAGSLVPPETEVELVVSQGPTPREVPNLVDVAGTEARVSVEDLGLVYVQERTEFSDDIEVGRVISQMPEAGTEIARGDAVSVVVSLGPDVVPFPDLSEAASYEQAAVILVEAGFEPTLTFGDAQGELLSVTIDGEDAVVGETYRRGTTVEIEAISPE